MNSEFLRGGKEEKVSSFLGSLYIPTGPISGAWKKKDNCQNALLAHKPWKCHSTAPLFPHSSLSHIFLIMLPLSRLRPSLSFSLLSSPLCLQPLPLSLLLSAAQCWSSHSACLQAVFLISLNYSRHFLFFFFCPTCPVNCTNLKLDNWKDFLKITFTLQLICMERTLWLQPFLTVQ